MNMNYKRGPLTAYAARGDFIESSFAQEDEEDNLNILGSPVSYYGLGPTSGAASAPKSEPIKIGNPETKSTALTTAGSANTLGSAPSKLSGSTQLSNDPLEGESTPSKGSMGGIFSNINNIVMDASRTLRDQMKEKELSGGGKMGNRVNDKPEIRIEPAREERAYGGPAEIRKVPKAFGVPDYDRTYYEDSFGDMDMTRDAAMGFRGDGDDESDRDADRAREAFLRQQAIDRYMGLEDARLREGTTVDERQIAEDERIEAERLARIEAESRGCKIS